MKEIRDENLGIFWFFFLRATLEIIRVAKKGELDTWITLEEAKHGMVHLRLTWFRLSTSPEDLKSVKIFTWDASDPVTQAVLIPLSCLDLFYPALTCPDLS